MPKGWAHTHSLSPSITSQSETPETIWDLDDDFNFHRARMVLGLAGSTTSEPQNLCLQEEDSLTQRINSMVLEILPRRGHICLQNWRLASGGKWYCSALVGKPDFQWVMKLCEKHLHPRNVKESVTPELTGDTDKMIDPKVVKDDRRLKSSQICATALTTALARELVMESLTPLIAASTSHL